ncbi:hypothetical protein N7471_002273 [Penicillium samsonianum]|uniref:uncharacterized protein n=1 Tax=Penicillium samsonianum TaxID=1882272 RepID=UPI0025470565|nr:uncharacterized protein N7471_002273 [Penicillium samsonianum]KAJ6142820.1 hypothetical protein N7471_002273 [Penicillium samsonianum]
MKDISKLKSEEVVRSYISYSLKNKATNWYDSELTDFEKDALRILPLEDGWENIELSLRGVVLNPDTTITLAAFLNTWILNSLTGKTKCSFETNVSKPERAAKRPKLDILSI